MLKSILAILVFVSVIVSPMKSQAEIGIVDCESLRSYVVHVGHSFNKFLAFDIALAAKDMAILAIDGDLKYDNIGFVIQTFMGVLAARINPIGLAQFGGALVCIGDKEETIIPAKTAISPPCIRGKQESNCDCQPGDCSCKKCTD